MKIGRGPLVLVLLALTVLAVTPAPAQVAGATLSGTVSDASGAAVPNAKVSIKNNATSVVTEVTTDTAGFYDACRICCQGCTTPQSQLEGFPLPCRGRFTLSVGASTKSTGYCLAGRPGE